jgi:hypothetical protein
LLLQNIRDQGSNLVTLNGLSSTTVFVSYKDATGQKNSSDYILMYPKNNTMNVNLSFGGESPNPFPIEFPNPNNINTGYPITFAIEQTKKIKVNNYTITAEGTDIPLDAYIRTKDNDPNSNLIGINEAYLIAKQPLKPLTWYTVSFTGTANEIQISRSWRFKTAEHNAFTF